MKLEKFGNWYCQACGAGVRVTGITAERALVVGDGQAELLEVVGALGAAGGLAGALHGRQQQGDQHGDDRDDDQKLDQSETGAAPRRAESP